MLAGDFFRIEAWQPSEAALQCTVRWNRQHAIFAAHFPTLPMVPGACLTEIVKELANRKFGKSLIIKKINNAKFTNFIQPDHFPTTDFQLNITATDEETLAVKAVVLSNEIVFAKFSLQLATKL